GETAHQKGAAARLRDAYTRGQGCVRNIRIAGHREVGAVGVVVDGGLNGVAAFLGVAVSARHGEDVATPAYGCRCAAAAVAPGNLGAVDGRILIAVAVRKSSD